LLAPGRVSTGPSARLRAPPAATPSRQRLLDYREMAETALAETEWEPRPRSC